MTLVSNVPIHGSSSTLAMHRQGATTLRLAVGACGHIFCEIFEKKQTRLVPVRGLPASISPEHLGKVRQMFSSNNFFIHWDGFKVSLSPKVKGGGGCCSTESEAGEREPLLGEVYPKDPLLKPAAHRIFSILGSLGLEVHIRPTRVSRQHF